MLCYNTKAVGRQRKYGGIAQLGERLNGIQEVSGSIPLISTTKHRISPRNSVFFLLFGFRFWQFLPFIYHLSTTYPTFCIIRAAMVFFLALSKCE